MSPLSKKIVIILSLVVIAFVATGYVRARSNDEKAYRALTVYSEVLDKVQNDYVDDPNIGQVTSGALHGLLDSLDAESAYLSPLEYKDFKEKSANTAAGETLAVARAGDYIQVSHVGPKLWPCAPFGRFSTDEGTTTQSAAALAKAIMRSSRR